jgi:hypothetical protein
MVMPPATRMPGMEMPNTTMIRCPARRSCLPGRFGGLQHPRRHGIHQRVEVRTTE